MDNLVSNKICNLHSRNWLKFSLGVFACLSMRLLPFRPPNIEPILATQMPFGRVYGAWAGFMFGILSIALYDITTNTLGVWTLITGGTYGVLGATAHFYFQKFKASSLSYVGFAVLGTLFFDAVTGLTIGPLFFNQSLLGAFWGQIPFTGLHLLGNVSFALLLSPAIDRLITKKQKSEKISIINQPLLIN